MAVKTETYDDSIFILVPREPTMGMWEDFVYKARGEDGKRSPTSFNGFYEGYKAMLAAAPVAPKGET